MNNTTDNKAIILWLLSIIVMVFAMIFIGGITRLTDSGLSMVNWKPIMGAIPPLNHEEWMVAFNQYKQFPEFQKINFEMDLAGFKAIYFWEYFHRLFGRLIGVVFFFPFVYFWLKKRINKQFSKKLVVAFILGGLQGLLGWYMVKSGLVNKPDVSQYRLCAHLLLALVIISYLVYLIHQLKYFEYIKSTKFTPWKNRLILFFTLLFIQLSYGAFVAGLDAGLTYNTFPKMGQYWLAKDMLFMQPMWINFFENTALVQFMHRLFGSLLLGFTLFLFFKNRINDNLMLKKSINMLVILVLFQFVLGVATLMLKVPLSLGSLHQLGAVLILILAMRAWFFTRYSLQK